MTSASSGQTRGGVGFTGLLAILFIGLKLGHVIDWSWWWVLAPLWIGPLLLLVVVAGLGVTYLVARVLNNRAEKRATERRGTDRGWGDW